jgi:carboxylate-amine ligase
LTLARLRTRSRTSGTDHGIAPFAARRIAEYCPNPLSASLAPTIGIEEELFVVDAVTRDCVADMPAAFFAEAEAALGDSVKREIISSMIELVTTRHRSSATALQEITANRRALATIAERHGLALLACGTHPFSDWQEQRLTDKPRYDAVAQSLGALSKRVHVCGLHVHVEIADPEARISVMNRAQRFLPLFLALSASSPFWRGAPTQLASYRSAANDETPRTGLPSRFESDAEFREFVGKMTTAGFIPDQSFLWWAIRPSLKYPTLELRISDCCTFPSHAIAIATLYRCLAYKLEYDGAFAAQWSDHHYLINGENRWQAIRFGLAARFMDPATAETRPISDVIADLAETVAPVALELGCADELSFVDEILTDGTSADRQCAVYDRAIAAGKSQSAAIARVADWVISATRTA